MRGQGRKDMDPGSRRSSLQETLLSGKIEAGGE